MRWLNDYVDCFEETGTSARLRYWAGVSAIGAALGRDVYVRVAPEHDVEHAWRIHPNFYIILIGDPGCGKSDAISQVRPFFRHVEVPLASNSGSKEQILVDMEENKGVLAIVSGELGVKLGGSGGVRGQADLGMLDMLCQMYDLEDTYQHGTVKSTNVMLERPFLSILGGMTPDILGRVLPFSAIGQGILSRVLLIYTDDLLDKPDEPKVDRTLRNQLLSQLAYIAQYRGEVVFDESATAAYRAWKQDYMAMMRKYRGRPVKHLIARFPGYVVRLASVHAAAQLDPHQFVVTEKDFTSAAEVLAETLPGMLYLMRSTGGNPLTYVQDLLLQRLRREGAMPLATFYREFRDYGTMKQLEQVVALLHRGELLKRNSNILIPWRRTEEEEADEES